MHQKNWDIPAKEYGSFYETYVKLVNGKELIQVLVAGAALVDQWYNDLPEEKLEYRYEPGKWTPREVLGHITDAEKVFAYRAFRISRGDQTPMAGFDQDPYIITGKFNERSIDSLLNEYWAVRNATIAMMETWSPDQYLLTGNASGVDISLRAQCAVMAGHELHHLNILNSRYL